MTVTAGSLHLDRYIVTVTLSPLYISGPLHHDFNNVTVTVRPIYRDRYTAFLCLHGDGCHTYVTPSPLHLYSYTLTCNTCPLQRARYTVTVMHLPLHPDGYTLTGNAQMLQSNRYHVTVTTRHYTLTVTP